MCCRAPIHDDVIEIPMIGDFNPDMLSAKNRNKTMVGASQSFSRMKCDKFVHGDSRLGNSYGYLPKWPVGF